MMMTSVITSALNTIVLVLTPVRRWEALNSQFRTVFSTEHWFLWAAAAILILTTLLLVVSLHRTNQQRTVNSRLFAEYAEKRGLSRRECQILQDIANKVGLKQNEAIFTMASAFDRGAALMIEESLAKQGAAETESLKRELSFLREKLGFQKQPPASIGAATRSRRLSSRQIPIGKKLHITRRKTRGLADIESTVVKNDDIELTVKLAMPLESTPGESWRARYYFGASVWEFDTVTVSSSGDILALNHSDDVRFVNRRRFLRVPVNKPAFVTSFPFASTIPLSNSSNKQITTVVKGPAKVLDSIWGPPKFVPSVVTEFAGPGLRIETPLEVKVGDRVLVIFRLDEENTQDVAPHQVNKEATLKIIEDIGVVRHTKAIQNGFSIAVELTGLSDSDLNELIRATNAASLKAGGAGQQIPAYGGDRQDAEKTVAEPTSV